jgi:uncharacterized protein YfaS (alpha-2-macroglobulin family)/tetratricopeptide (TPR) repeat protein
VTNRIGWVIGFALLVTSASGTVEPAAPGELPTAAQAIAPAAPALPADIVTALQEKRYADAVAALDRLDANAKATADEKSYHALIRGIAHHLAGQLQQARKALMATLLDKPAGPWAPKVRAELAAVELAAGRYAEAAALARTEAERLLDGGRKDRLAEVYRAFARRLLEPDAPVTPPDPEGAYALLAQGRGLAQGSTQRARLLFEMARASQAAKNYPRAIQDFTAYLHEYPRGADRNSARYHLGEAQAQAGQAVEARLTWTDLARDLEKVDTKAGQDTRAGALYQAAHTYGIPNPPDDGQLNLGVAALRRFLAAAPAHPLAVRAAHEIGEAYMARGQSQEALAAFNAFLAGDRFKPEEDEGRRTLAELSMSAQFRIGQILQGQEKFAEAITAYRAYLARYPNGPQSADSQKAILDVQLAVAVDHSAHERHAEARAAWTAFVAQYPLDARIQQVLYQVGESFVPEKKYDDAIAAWETLAGKFPGTEPAAHGQFRIAELFETEKGDPATAIDRFKKVAVEPWAAQARERIAVMEAKALTVVTPRTFRSGEKPYLKVSTRNLDKLMFTAFKIDPEAYFRKKHTTGGVEELDIGLVQPDAEWTAEVPRYAKYKPIETTYELKDVSVPGVYVVKVSDDKALQATTLVVGSDLDAIVKTSRDQLLVFAQDMKTGASRAGARVIVSDGSSVIIEATTGRDGVLLRDWDKPREPNSSLTYLVLDGNDTAGSGLGVPEKVAQGLTPRAYLATDRPAYRPGQEVKLRGVVREVVDGQYASEPKAVYRLEVADSRGRQFYRGDAILSAFGTFNQTIPLDSTAPVGTYQVRLYRPGKTGFNGQFEVQAYELRKADLAFDLPRTVYFRGETISADIVARYQYGTPLAGRPLVVGLPGGRVLNVQTDAAGKYHIEVPTDGFAEEQMLRIVAQLPQDGVSAAASVSLAVRAFRIELGTSREVYLAGESIPIRIATTDPLGEPAGQSLNVVLLKRVAQGERTIEREVVRKAAQTDAKTGAARVALTVDDEDGGSFVVRATGTDRFGNPVVAEHGLTISGKRDETRLRLLSDRTSFPVGEQARVELHNRDGAGTALVTWEADRMLRYKLVAIREGRNELAWDVDGKQFPNFTLAASRMAGTKLHEARLDLRAERELRVTVVPRRAAVGPAADVQVEVTTVDQLGRPVAAEVALALVDQALLRLHGDKLPPIGPFFHNQTRTGAFATESSITFKYEPGTEPQIEALVEELERTAAMVKDAEGRKELIDSQNAQVQEKLIDSLSAKRVKPEQAPHFWAKQAGRPAAGAPAHGAYRGLSTRAGDGRAGMEVAAEAFDAESDKDQNAADQSNKKAPLVLFVPIARDRSPQPRQQFVETAYWNPSVVTGADGKALVTFKAPTALSKYRFTARGVTGSDTLVGQATAELAVQQDFFVDLKTPASLTEGDKPRFSAQVHHTGVLGKLELALKIYAGGAEQVYPRTIDFKADGVDEVLFEPFPVPDADSARLTLTGRVGDASDEMTVEVPIRPWGVQALASSSGSASDDATAFVGLPPGRDYQDPEMLIVVSPTLRRMIVELALGREGDPLFARRDHRLMLPPNTMADRAGDLIAAGAALAYLKESRATDAPEAIRLRERARGIVGELITAQNDDGGWPWVSGSGPANPPSDRLTSARVALAVSAASGAGLMFEPKTVEKAVAYLTQELGKSEAGDHETRAALLHALSAHGKASFEQANALNRLRQDLPDVALAYLALTFANLDRAGLAGEALDILGARARTEPAEPGGKPRRYWEGARQGPWHRSAAETTALAALAFARTRPQADVLAGAVDWLLAHRVGEGWLPPKARGPALAALGAFYGKADRADDRYRLIVTVNDAEVGRIDVDGASLSKTIGVPRRVLKVGDKNRVKFAIEGRGRFGYAITMTGFARDFAPDQDRRDRRFTVNRRVYWAPTPVLDGKPLPTGFGVALNAQPFENTITQLPAGGATTVSVECWRDQAAGQPAWERDFLVLQEHLPAGTTLVEGSVKSQASHSEYADGVLTLYFAPDQWPGCTYDVFGFLPGHYRALPPRIASAYEPGRSHLGPEGTLRVLAPGEKSTDAYKPTPDELYARGKAEYEAGRLAEAAAALEGLWAGYTLRDEVARDAARLLLAIHIREYDARKVVQFFEVLKEKAPELVIPFDDIKIVGRAYGDIGEHERAYLVWRATTEASYLEDARVGEVLRQRGKALEGIAYLINLWREYPSTASIQSDFFGLSQLVATKATAAITDPATRAELSRAGVTRSDLLGQAIRLVQVFLAQAPNDPLADEASLALVGSFLELEDFDTVVKLSRRYAELHARSTFLDSFQYSEALGRFHLGEYDRAIAVAEKIAAATYKDKDGVDQPSANKWQALYILGQIYDARRQPGKALAYYERVADRFTDAAGAVEALKRKSLKLPEVAVVRRAGVAAATGGVGLRAIPAEPPEERPVARLDYRNIAHAEVKVYPVDLMRLYLGRRNLDNIAGVDLAGIKPLYQTAVELGDGKDYDDRARSIDLPIQKEGAYLLMVRGDDLHVSEVMLVSPLALDVVEDVAAGRVRVTVRDARTKDLVPKVQVKVIGSANATFFSGQTDLRGVFVAEGVRGQATAVARKGTSQYAFYRGTTALGPPATPATTVPAAIPPPAGETRKPQSLDDNLRSLNSDNQKKQMERLQERYKPGAAGVQVEKAR